MLQALLQHPGLGDTNRIVLTTDLSKESLRAFAPVVDLARRLGFRLTLLHVVHEPVLGGIDNLAVAKDMQDAEKRLAEYRAALPDDVEIDIVVLSGDDVVRTIVQHAEDHNAILALATHGRTGVRRLVLGSVAENILRQSVVPVLCFPHRQPAPK
jgi:nucleotide-binding universal stress UspA family protein